MVPRGEDAPRARFDLSNTWFPYVVAIASVGIVVAVRVMLRAVADHEASLTLLTGAVMFTAWYGGLRPGFAATAAGALAGDYYFLEPFYSLGVESPSELLTLGLFVLEGATVSYLAESLRRSKVLAENNARRVREMSGLLPICANCKKIRDDRGYWHQVEAYIASHSQAEFSHGICPDCFRVLYPDFAYATEPRDPAR